MSEAHPRPSEPSHSAGDVEVAVIGAGQAGLAIGHFLARAGRRFVILEAGESVGTAWRERWDSLRCSRRAAMTRFPACRSPAIPTAIPAATR